jgi:hypothetical protein
MRLLLPIALALSVSTTSVSSQEACRGLEGPGVLNPYFDTVLRAKLTGNATMWQQAYTYADPGSESTLFGSIEDGGTFTVDALLSGSRLSPSLDLLLATGEQHQLNDAHLFTLRPEDFATFVISSQNEFAKLARDEAAARKFQAEKLAERYEFDNDRSDIETFFTRWRFQSMFLEGYAFDSTMNRIANDPRIPLTPSSTEFWDSWRNGPNTPAAPEYLYYKSVPALDAIYKQQLALDSRARSIAYNELDASLSKRITDVWEQRSLLVHNFNSTLSTMLHSYGVCSAPCLVGETSMPPGSSAWVRQGEVLAHVATDLARWELSSPAFDSATILRLASLGEVGNESYFLKLKFASTSPGSPDQDTWEFVQPLPVAKDVAVWLARRQVSGSLSLQLDVPEAETAKLVALFTKNASEGISVTYEVLGGRVKDFPQFDEAGLWEHKDPNNYDLSVVCSAG